MLRVTELKAEAQCVIGLAMGVGPNLTDGLALILMGNSLVLEALGIVCFCGGPGVIDCKEDCRRNSACR